MRSNRRRTALIGLSAAAYRTLVRPRLLRSGATEAEVRGSFPGAEIVPGGTRTATMAATIDAPPSAVWPWLLQMGCDRGGWYSWDRLDNGGAASAERVHPEWQDLSVGDHLASSPSGRVWFEVAAVEHERLLALRAPLDLRRGRPYDPAGPRPRMFSDSVWTFLLESPAGGRTRLVVSGYAASSPRVLTAILDAIFWEPAHWVMQTRQLANLRRRAERGLPEARVPG